MNARPVDDRLLRRLLEWRPNDGIVSVYVDVDPADRGQGWRIELRDRLRRLVESTPPHEVRHGFEVAAKRILGRFPQDRPPTGGRGQVGFVEVNRDPAEVWRSMQIPPPKLEVIHARRASVAPLVEMLDQGAATGVVLVSAERVKLLEWSLGMIEKLEDWEIVLWSRDWRERKAERIRDPARVQGTSAAGRDQFDQRLEANRERFLHEVGELVRTQLSARGWSRLLAFGDEHHVQEVAAGLGAEAERLHSARHNLITAREPELGQRIVAELGEMRRTRVQALIRQMREGISASPGVALGKRETLRALDEGRVRHLVLDPERHAHRADNGVSVAERMIELAIETGAQITPVRDQLAEEIDEHEGVVALLRY